MFRSIFSKLTDPSLVIAVLVLALLTHMAVARNVFGVRKLIGVGV